MTTFYVHNAKGRQVMTTHDKAKADAFAVMVSGYVVPIERALTAGELMAAEQRLAAA